MTLPGEYLKHLLQALSALIFQSNFAFNSDNGYFAMVAQTKTLLHTWSLSLEGQFYFWMPLVVPLVWRLASGARPRLGAVMTTFQVVAALSLAWCLWESQNDATGSSFFSLPARAWEPLAGGLVAIAELQRRSESENPAKAAWLETRTIAVLGWALVAGCILSPFPEARWPGLLTILPILGAAMIVGARQGAGTGGLLAISPIQRIGDWSYSIYLWHWPIWVFALSWLSLRGYGVDATQKILMILASLALGVISYRFVEQPVRLRRDFWTPRRLWASSGAALALSLGFVALAFLNRGFPNRLPGYMLPAELARSTITPRDECFRDSNSNSSWRPRPLLQFREARGGRGEAFRDPVGGFICQPISRSDFCSGARPRNPRADRDTEWMQGVPRQSRWQFRRSAVVPDIQPQHAGFCAGPD